MDVNAFYEDNAPRKGVRAADQLAAMQAENVGRAAARQGLRPNELLALNDAQDAAYANARKTGVPLLRQGMPQDSFGTERGGFWRGNRRVTDGNLNQLAKGSPQASIGPDRYFAGGYDQPRPPVAPVAAPVAPVAVPAMSGQGSNTPGVWERAKKSPLAGIPKNNAASVNGDTLRRSLLSRDLLFGG